MQTLCLQLTDSIHNLHHVLASRIFVAICRGFWDRMGQILDDLFASEMQKLLGNSLQDKDLDPPRAVIEARSILC
ncbi:hypothetical protein BHE74_00047782 [Ensete ventricosum]|nr:hypothetical protein BHE74_00047782 [Ensete ventricosum]RZS21197.1 hypothetical protein BHM03_00053805 [Ensete ventricosum]